MYVLLGSPVCFLWGPGHIAHEAGKQSILGNSSEPLEGFPSPSVCTHSYAPSPHFSPSFPPVHTVPSPPLHLIRCVLDPFHKLLCLKLSESYSNSQKCSEESPSQDKSQGSVWLIVAEMWGDRRNRSSPCPLQ